MTKRRPPKRNIIQNHPVSKGNTEKIQSPVIQSQSFSFIKHLKKNWINYITIFSLLLNIYLLFVSPTKKDIEPIKKIDPIDENVSFIKKSVINIEQNLLVNDDYKKYLEIFHRLYKNYLENLFSGGYITFGLRNNEIYSPDELKSKFIQTDVKGRVEFFQKNCKTKLDINKITFVETRNSLGGFSVITDIIDYKVFELYQINFPLPKGWKQGIIILSDDITNPVFVYGFYK